MHEGVRLGLLTATITWVWVALIDQFAGQPLHAFTVLGGVAAFTIGHYLLNIAFAVVVVSAIRAAKEAPSLIIALIFGFVMLEVGFAMLAAVLGQTGLGTLAWVQVFAGSLIAFGVVFSHLLRNYPFGYLLHQAEEER